MMHIGCRLPVVGVRTISLIIIIILIVGDVGLRAGIGRTTPINGTAMLAVPTCATLIPLNGTDMRVISLVMDIVVV
jgi:hypothetical protein